MFCPQCGNQCGDGVAYCSGCGSRLVRDSAPWAPAITPRLVVGVFLAAGLIAALAVLGGHRSSSSSDRASLGSSSVRSDDFEIVDVSTRVTERNEVWSRFAWRLTLRNKTPHALYLHGTIEFQDADGFVVDQDATGSLGLDPESEKTFTGQSLVTAAAATKVSNVVAKVGAL